MTLNSQKITFALAVSFVAMLSISCDPLHKSKCEWYLIPEKKHIDTVKAGWVSLCAKNYTIGRQKCFIQTKISFAEKNYGRVFKLNDLELDEKTFPRKVLKIKFCAKKAN